MPTELELLTDIYAAFNRRDIESVLSAMHPDVDWPNGWEGGRVVGHQAIRDYWTRQWAAINPTVEPLRFDSDNAGRILVQVHQQVRDLQNQVLFDGIVAHIYEIENGLIKSMNISEPGQH